MATSKPKDCIAGDLQGCLFKVSPNEKADGSEPIYEIAAFSEVGRHSANIDRVARELGLDADLLRSIIYIETTHGYYDAPLALFDANKSLLPMNVNVQYWGDVFGSRA